MFLSRTDLMDTNEKNVLVLLTSFNAGHTELRLARSSNLDVLVDYFFNNMEGFYE